jgi:hypothetical protein
VPRALCALADAEHFTISEGEVDGNIVQFTQTYDDGDQTRWRAVVKEDAHGVVSMVHGTWSGHIEGRFDARRSSDRREAEQRSGGSTQAARQVVVTTSSRAAGGGQKVAELQLTLSSLEHRLQQQTEHVQDLQEQRAQVEAELHLEVSTAPLRSRACAARCVRKCVYYNRKRLCVCVCVQRSNHGSTQDALEDLRQRFERLASSGDGHVDSTSRVDHLNDRLIARHQEVDQILAASASGVNRPQRQQLQLGVAQVRCHTHSRSDAGKGASTPAYRFAWTV